jgi:hypothetical protein
MEHGVKSVSGYWVLVPGYSFIVAHSWLLVGRLLLTSLNQQRATSNKQRRMGNRLLTTGK